MNKENWETLNQKYLISKINQIKSLLEKYVSDKSESIENVIPSQDVKWHFKERLSAFEQLSRFFGLSEFEKSILLLCAGVELDPEMSILCKKAQGLDISYPTFGLALKVLQEPHWSALSPVSPLRQFRLIDLYGHQQLSLTKTPLYIEEKILHYLTGVYYLEKQLQGIVRPVKLDELVIDSHKSIVKRIVDLIKNTPKGTKLPVICLKGEDKKSKMSIARVVCNEIGLHLWEMSVDSILLKPEFLDNFISLWKRESVLLGTGLYIALDSAPDDSSLHTGKLMVNHLAESLTGPIFLGVEETSLKNQDFVLIDVHKPTKHEQYKIWESHLEKISRNHGHEDTISQIVSQYDFDIPTIQSAMQNISFMNYNETDDLENQILHACRMASRKQVKDLLQRIIPKARLEDLILSEKQKQILFEIIIHVRQKNMVYEKWGFEDKSGTRGLGITALFEGESGTGKTMAAEVLANELNLDLLRVDLSMVVSKYIGETEKNLRNVFDSAQNGGSILFFDEADALFGKRTEVRDSHDRYANIEVGYLLQKMEEYRGLAILATNMKNSIDTAFLRRIRFIVSFPFPDEKSRGLIWNRIFPASTPTDKLDISKLARLNIAGGNIRNIALNATFLAAHENIPVNMSHMKKAAMREYEKMERSLTGAEIGDWN